MAGIDGEEVKAATRDIIRKASEDSTLHEITPRQIRQRIEKQLGLEEGSLDAREYKDAVKVATAEAMEELENKAEPEEDRMQVDEAQQEVEEKPAASKKRKSDAAASGSKKKPRAEKAKETVKAKNKPSSASKPKSEDDTKKQKGQRIVRSASVVPSSDEEGDDKPKSKPSKPASISRKEVSPTPEAEGSKEEPASEDDEPEASRPEPADQHASNSEDHNEAPKRVRGKKKVVDDSATKAAKGRKRKAKDTDESPEDAEIKRLKSFVTACGVRKVWSKEFKDVADDKSAQVRRLKALLAELGMTGRLSMEKAKAIRAKRELAQELEDVKNFEKAVVSGPGESKRAKREQPAKQTDESDEEAEDVDVPRKRRAPNARMSIMAFLGDQSDEE